MGNDASLAALDEVRFGAGQGVEGLTYLTISTGTGGGIILGGRLRGGQGLGGEVDHIVVEPQRPWRLCRGRSCLEALAVDGLGGQRL